jgi:hypothetical protein
MFAALTGNTNASPRPPLSHPVYKGDIQLALHRTKPVVRLEWISRMGERRRVTPQKVRTPVAGLLRWRRRLLSVDLPQSLNSDVYGSHHLHLELEELLRSQGRRHRCRLAGTLVVLPLLARTRTGAPGVHHLIAAERNL